MVTPRQPGTGPTQDDVPTKRSRRRRGVIRRSEHRDEYERLIRAGWSSYALERYALYRYGEDIPSRTWRDYIKALEGSDLVERSRPEAEKMTLGDHDPDKLVDILALRSEMVALQQQRIVIDVGHERSTKRLFSTTNREIQLLSQLLDAVKGDMQDLGLLPKAGDILNVRHSRGPDPTREAPRYPTLAAALGDDRPDVEAQVARMLHDAMPADLTPGNGQVIEGEVG